MNRRGPTSAAGVWCAALAAGCSLLRPLDDLETAQGSLASPPCPDEMQQIRYEDGATFCIDRRETTRAEYEEFLEASVSEPPPPLQLPTLCPAEVRIEPGGGADCQSAYERGVEPELPVACVDLCAAQAYCGFRGKRLCGGRGGEAVDQHSRNTSDDDEWFMACTGDTARAYPYAANFDPGRCNVESESLEAVDSTRGCETPDHIQQLSGNVAEWVLICKEFRLLDETRCLVRGGDYRAERSLAGCYHSPRGTGEGDAPLGRLPTERDPGVGIRCCRD